MAKWGCHDVDERIAILNFVLQHEGLGTPMSHQGLDAALTILPRKHKCDAHGISLLFLRMWFEAAPAATLDFFNHVMSSTPLLSLWEVSGIVLGKNSSHTVAADTRAILPLPAVLVIIDAFLCARWDHWINMHVAQPYGVHIGARPKTQSLDITHSLHLIIEQGLDAKNGSAVAQSDILSYFDSLPLLSGYLRKGHPLLMWRL